MYKRARYDSWSRKPDGRNSSNSPVIEEHLYKQVQEQSEFCDLTIRRGTWERKYHWCVLSVSPFFSKLHASKMKERETGVLNLSIGTPDTIQNALNFFYGKEPEIDLQNAFQLMEIADFLMLDEFKQFCLDIVQSYDISVSTCLPLLFISSHFEIYNAFFETAKSFYFSNLPKLMMQEELLLIDKESVRAILTDKTLSYVDRQDCLNFVHNWIGYSSDRKAEAHDLLSCMDSSPDKLKDLSELCSNRLTQNSDTLQEVLVIYPPELKYGREMFYIYSFKAECWYRIPIKCESVPLGNKTAVQNNDTVVALSADNATFCYFNLISGLYQEMKLQLMECDENLNSSQILLATCGEKVIYLTNFLIPVSARLISDIYDDIMLQVSSTLYLSEKEDSDKIYFKPVFSLVGPIEAICVCESRVCLLNREKKLLVSYCITDHEMIRVDLEQYEFGDGVCRLSSHDSIIYILLQSVIISINLKPDPAVVNCTLLDEVVEKVENENTECYEVAGSKLVKVIENNCRITGLQCHELRQLLENRTTFTEAGCCKTVHIDIPMKLSDKTRHEKLMQLKLPMKALCHIDCPHCKVEDMSKIDLFSIQRTFSPDDDSWNSSHLSDTDIEENGSTISEGDVSAYESDDSWDGNSDGDSDGSWH